MPTQIRRERRIALPAGTGVLLVRVFSPGGPRRGFADAERRINDHLGINLVLAGSGGYRLGRQQWLLRPGTVFVRWPGRRHSTWSDAAYAECSLGFCASWLPQLVALGAIPGQAVTPGPPQPQTAVELAMLAADLADAPPTAGPELVLRAAAVAARCLARTAQADHPLDGVRQAIERDPALRLPPLSAAQRRAFRVLTGHAPQAFRQRLRLEQARELLRAGHPVKEVASRLGYSAPEALTVQFRARYGVPPSRAMAASR